MIGQRKNHALVAENHKYEETDSINSDKFRTIVSEVSAFVGNPVGTK